MPNKLTDMHVYIIRRGKSASGYYKVGISRSPAKRLSELQIGSPQVLKIILTAGPISKQNALSVERAVRHKYEQRNHSGEWYHLGASMLGEFVGFVVDEVTRHAEAELTLQVV